MCAQKSNDPISIATRKADDRPVKDKAVAFYLVGHGPLREPRLIELQHRRILRYRNLARHPDENRLLAPEIFIDLNIERGDPDQHPEKLFPQFHKLLVAIAEGHIGIVYVDVMENQSQTVNYSWVTDYLQKVGAQVINVFYDENDVLDLALKESFGSAAASGDVNDASDFVCFFPRLAVEVAFTAAGSRTFRIVGSDEVMRRLGGLWDSSPYSRGRVPFVEDRLGEKWTERGRNRKTRKTK